MKRIEVYDIEAEALEQYADEHDTTIEEVIYELVDQYLDELEM